MSNKNKSVASKKKWAVKNWKIAPTGRKKAGVNGMVYIMYVL